MTYFLRSGTSFRVTSKESMDLHEVLPAGNYTIAQDPFGNFSLVQIDSFELPSKLYGKTARHTERIINTFLERSPSTGVMLNGEKGSGKSLLAKNISAELATQGVPTIVINHPWTGDGFFKLIQDIDQPCVVLFDEFEKVYDREGQESILTLLDGVFGSKKLYIITCNDKWRVDQNMRNRPGRIFYMIDFKGLDASFVTEYCQDNLINKSHISQITGISGLFTEFNFDMLKALVEEMNRYGESPQEALEMLNAKPEFDGGSEYQMRLVRDGVELTDEHIHPVKWRGSPLNQDGVVLEYDPDPKNDDSDWVTLRFNSQSLVKVDAMKGSFIFEDQGSRLIMTRVQVPKMVDYESLLF